MIKLLGITFLLSVSNFCWSDCIRGDCRNGYGTALSDGWKYVGEYKDGFPNGQGTFTWPDGQKYVGEFKDGKKNGQGTFTWPDGQKYVGEFKDGKKNGQGTQTFPDGWKYVGEYKDGERHGRGTFTSPDGRKYVGEFKDGKKNGQGTQTFPDGWKYVGEYKDGFPNGQGTFTWPDGQKYVGEFKDGKQNGRGTFTSPDGRKYVGEFKDDKRNGQGTYTWPDGRKYVGEFKDGTQNGQGTFTWPDGQKYVGEFKDGKQNGRGTLTLSGGERYVGQFKDGEYRDSYYSIKDFWPGMTKQALKAFAEGTDGAVFLDEGDYYLPFGSDHRLPRGVSRIDFNYCGAAPQAADYNDSILSKTESLLNSRKHRKCLRDYGTGGSYTIFGLLAAEVTRRIKSGEEKFEAGVYKYTCVELDILTTTLEHEQVQESFGPIREELDSKFGRSTVGDVTYRGQSAHWERGWSELYPDRYETLSMGWSLGLFGPRLGFKLRDCKYSKKEDPAKVDLSDF